MVASGAYDQHVGANEVMGLCVQILSKSYAPPTVQRAIDAFLVAFPAIASALTASEYETTRAAMVTRLLEPHRTLAEAFSARWAPLEHDHFDWAQKRTLARALEQTTLADVVSLAEEVGRAGSALPRLSVHVYGNPHVEAFGADDGTAAVPIEDVEAWRQAQPTWPRRA